MSVELMKSFGEMNKKEGASESTVTADSVNNSLILKGYCWATDGEYIEIDCTKTFYYDIIFSNTSGSQLYLGFERFDKDKTSTSNDSCIYTLNTSEECTNKRVYGVVNLSKDANNSDVKYIKLRILNSWNSSTNTTNIASFKLISLRQVDSIYNPEFNKNGNVLVDSIREDEKFSIYKNGFVEAYEIIEY